MARIFLWFRHWILGICYWCRIIKLSGDYMKLLVCGGRDFTQYQQISEVLYEFKDNVATPTILIHGGANGADSLAGLWAIENGIHPVIVPALWDFHGKSAGFKRNFIMVEILKPDYCVAFPGGKGTQSTIDLCKRNNITVWQPYG